MSATSAPSAMSDLWRLRRRSRRAPDRRAELARIPERPRGVNRIQPLLEAARVVGVSVEEIDEEHVRLRYDALMRDQWLAVEAVYDAVQELASLEGDGHTDAAPDNWMVVHFDFASCGESLGP